MGAVIAVEGPDLAGKTTFIKALTEIPPLSTWPVFHLNMPKELLKTPDTVEIEWVSEAWARGLVEMKKRGLSFILDRCYVSSYVYAGMFGRQANLSYISNVAWMLRPVIVYVRTKPDALVGRLYDRGDMLMKSRSQVLAAHEAYESWLLRNPFSDRVIVYNQATDGPYEVALRAKRLVLDPTPVAPFAGAAHE